MPSLHNRKTLPAFWRFPLLILVSSWLIFCIAASVYYAGGGHDWQTALFIVFGITPLGIAKFAADTRKKWWPALEQKLLAHTARIDELSNLKLRLKLRWSIALAAGAGLYLELVLIRYHGTCFAIFGFFKFRSLYILAIIIYAASMIVSLTARSPTPATTEAPSLL
jgi:hypothetical protein